MQLMAISLLMVSAASAATIDITGSFASAIEGPSVSVSGSGLTFGIQHPQAFLGGNAHAPRCNVGDICTIDFAYSDGASFPLIPGRPAFASYNGISVDPFSPAGRMQVNLLFSAMPTLVTSANQLTEQGTVSGRITAWTDNSSTSVPFLDFLISGTGSLNIGYDFPAQGVSVEFANFTGTASSVPEPGTKLMVGVVAVALAFGRLGQGWFATGANHRQRS